MAVVVARGPLTTRDLATEVLSMLGHGWRRVNDPITVADVEHELYRLEPQLTALDLLATSRHAWTAGPSARSLLPGATLLADLV